MSYKSIFQILLFLAIIGTIFICIKKPQMHENVFVYNSDYKITMNNQPAVTEQEVQATMQVTNKDVQIQNGGDIQLQNIQTTPVQTNITPVQTQVVPAKIQTSTVKTVTAPVKFQTNPVTVQKTNTSNQKTSTSETPKINIQQILSNNKNISNQPNTVTTPSNAPDPVKTRVNNTKTTVTPQNVQTQPVKVQTQTTPVKTQTTTVQPKQLTAQEEEIAWNIWHSNLTNQVMKDVNLPKVPNGTIFRFKFTVDKYGKITNLQTWSDDSKYTPYAIQYIAPVIRSYQGRTILNFPAGSARVTNVAQSAWKISNTTRYSTPNDFDDVEKIKR